MTFVLLITLLILFTLASGFFSLAFIAIFSLSAPEIKLYAQAPDPRKEKDRLFFFQTQRSTCYPSVL